MTKLANRVKKLANQLKVTAVLNLEVNSPDTEGRIAAVELSSLSPQATIRLHPAFDNLSHDEQRQSIVHELIHTLLWPQECVTLNLENQLSQPVYEYMKKMHEREIELLTVKLASILTPLLEDEK